MRKVGIVTLYRGYNYGTSLQAYALKTVIESLGYKAEIIWSKENAHSGRDIRLIKILRMGMRMLRHPQLFKTTFNGYKKSLGAPVDAEIKQKFIDFEEKYLQVIGMSKCELKRYAKSKDTAAVVCGSDQIWSAAGANVEPLYYLRFAPQQKRVAYAPSFGASEIPSYNRAIIKKYISEFNRISVREDRGAEMIKDLLGIEVPVLVDPTLLLGWDEWRIGETAKDYILLYFLDEPNDDVIAYIQQLNTHLDVDIYALPYRFEQYDKLPFIKYMMAGPKEFVSLVANATLVVTDSFHGTAFSINFNVPFYTFARNYGGVQQTSRITSLLHILGLESQYIDGHQQDRKLMPTVDFKKANAVLTEQRKLAKSYLQEAIESSS